MILLLPVSRFRVHYEVAEGYPFSKLQRLILGAVAAGVSSKDELVNTFRIHPRLLIEALVTLTHAGWVALGPSSKKQFLLTPAGARAVKTEELPESTAVNRRQSYVLLERLSGSVIPEGEVRYTSRRALQRAGIWTECVEVPVRIFDNKLDESRVQHLLPRDQGQRLHWVGPIDMVTKGDSFIPLSIEGNDGLVVNLPHRCERVLRPLVLDIAQQESVRKDGQGVLNWDDLTRSVRLGRGRPGNVNVLGTAQQNWRVQWSRSDLVCERGAYDELITAALTNAQTAALIAGRCVTVEGLDRFERPLIEALDRGVDVDILWGFVDDTRTVDWLKKRSYDAKQRGATGRLRHNQSSVFSNAKLILWDEIKGFRGVVGTHDWLIESAVDERVSFALMISHPAILSTLSWCAAGFWSRSQSEALSSVPDRWRRIAVDLESLVSAAPTEEASSADSVSIRIVLDREHAGILHEWIASTQMRLVIASADLDATVEKRLSRLPERDRGKDFVCQVLFGNTMLESDGLLSAQKLVEAANGILRRTPLATANALVSDRSVCIGSNSFLSGTPDSDQGAREIGLIIEGFEAANAVASQFVHIS